MSGPSIADIAATDAVSLRIRSVRLGKKISLSKLAVLTGIARPNLSRIENGWHHPTLLTLIRIANGLGVSPARFFPMPKTPTSSP